MVRAFSGRGHPIGPSWCKHAATAPGPVGLFVKDSLEQVNGPKSCRRWRWGFEIGETFINGG